MKQRGFTLIELLMATVMIGIIVLAMVRFSQTFIESYDFSFEETRAISQAESAIRGMEADIRKMRDGQDGSYPLVTADDNEIVFYTDTDNDNEIEKVRYYLVGNDLIKQVFEYEGGISNYACVGGCDICHSETNNLNIPEPAWPAHSAHGDYLGICGGGGGGGGPGSDDYERIVASFIRNAADSIFTYYNGDWPGDVINNPLGVGERLLNTRLVEIGVRVNIDPQTDPQDFEVRTSIQLRNLKDNL